MGQVIEFKQKDKPKIIGHRISFYSEEEIHLTLLALNVYGFEEIKYNKHNIKDLEPLYIKKCLLEMRTSELMSGLAIKVINSIINNIIEVNEGEDYHAD
tara:strand:- start:199 stop:495 length:297 start_codon:yes stop_codon:yes gene_type:complete